MVTIQWEYIENSLNALISPNLHLHGRDWSAFQFFGSAGLMLAVLLAILLVIDQHLSLYVMFGIVIAAGGTFFLLAITTKIVIGEERLIYYHHEIAIMLVATLVLWLLHQPILAYLDVTLLGIGTVLAFGRIGCLMVGCCHGRPHRFGICYGEEHAHAGFTPYYVGVRLFPIQVVESLWVAGTVSVGVATVLHHHPAGAALAWYIINYDIGRFFFEFMRGDPSRLYGWGFSEGQWIAVALMLVVVWLELFGPVPYEPWHVVATATLVLIMTAIGVTRRFRKTAKYRLLNPQHVLEIAQAMDRASDSNSATTIAANENPIPDHIPVQRTSLGICISANRTVEGPERLRHYAISCHNANMTDEIAQIVASVMLTIKHGFDSKELLRGKHGVYHLLLRHHSEDSLRNST